MLDYLVGITLLALIGAILVIVGRITSYIFDYFDSPLATPVKSNGGDYLLIGILTVGSLFILSIAFVFLGEVGEQIVNFFIK